MNHLIMSYKTINIEREKSRLKLLRGSHRYVLIYLYKLFLLNYRLNTYSLCNNIERFAKKDFNVLLSNCILIADLLCLLASTKLISLIRFKVNNYFRITQKESSFSVVIYESH